MFLQLIGQWTNSAVLPRPTCTATDQWC